MIGIDEAGRGAFAGPMVLAACKLNEAIKGLNDSKKLSKSKREYLYNIIINKSIYKVVFIDADFIDENGIRMSYHKALTQIKAYFNNSTELLFDGNTDYGSGIKTLINADETEQDVMAASIIAKYTRDMFMMNLNDTIYDFCNNKGYGTAKHIKAIKEFGLSKYHRRSFCEKYCK